MFPDRHGAAVLVVTRDLHLHDATYGYQFVSRQSTVYATKE